MDATVKTANKNEVVGHRNYFIQCTQNFISSTSCWKYFFLFISPPAFWNKTTYVAVLDHGVCRSLHLMLPSWTVMCVQCHFFSWFISVFPSTHKTKYRESLIANKLHVPAWYPTHTALSEQSQKLLILMKESSCKSRVKIPEGRTCSLVSEHLCHFLQKSQEDAQWLLLPPVQEQLQMS